MCERIVLTERTFRIICGWDGRKFAGWQRQPKNRTIQDALLQAIRVVFPELDKLQGCGRTDRGVHAEAYVASGTVANPDVLDTASILSRIRAEIPLDIVIHAFEWTVEGFHARYNAQARRYRMMLLPAQKMPPEYEGLVTQVHYKADPYKMAASLRHFCGTHDFTAFASEASGLCTLHEIRLGLVKDLWVIKVTGNRFLRHQVRMMTGAAISAAYGRSSQDEIVAGLNDGKYRASFTAVPASGLTFESVWYPDGWSWQKENTASRTGGESIQWLT